MHCVKSVRIRSFSGSYFPEIGLKTAQHSVQMRENTEQKNSEYRHFSRSDELRQNIFAKYKSDFLKMNFASTDPVHEDLLL